MLISLVDTGLRGRGEHSYVLLKRVRDALVANNIEAQIFCSLQAGRDVIAELDAVPKFRDYLYGGRLPGLQTICTRLPHLLMRLWNRQPVYSEARTAFVANKRFYEDLVSLPPMVWDKNGLVVFSAISQNQLLGLADFIERADQTDGCPIVCQLMMNVDWTPWGEIALRGAEFYEEAFSRLRPFSRRVRFTAENEAMAKAFRARFNLEIDCLPVPLAVRHLQRVPTLRPRLGFFGYAKGEKGFALLPDAIAHVRACGLAVDFVVQIHHDHWEAETIEAEKRLRMLPDIKIIEGELSETDYIAASRDVDIVLLPYDPRRFGHRGSGILTESIAAARPVVVSAGLYAAELVETGGASGEIFEPYSAEALCDAIKRLITRLDEALAQARGVADAFVVRHDGRAYVEVLLNVAADLQSASAGPGR